MGLLFDQMLGKGVSNVAHTPSFSNMAQYFIIPSNPQTFKFHMLQEMYSKSDGAILIAFRYNMTDIMDG